MVSDWSRLPGEVEPPSLEVLNVCLWHLGTGFSGNGGVGLMAGPSDLSDLFQLK